VRIAVLGASGSTGRMVASLLERGIEVAVLVRDPQRLGDRAGKVRVVVTALGGSASIGQLGLLGQVIYRRVIGRERLAEVNRQESQIVASQLDRTLVRPPRLVDGSPVGYRVAGPGKLPSGITLARADLAAVLVDEALAPRHVRQAITVCSA
jgi:uncharacterized protein YbjT (DUF2867 family)